MKREFNVEIKNGMLKIYLDGERYNCSLELINMQDDPIKYALKIYGGIEFDVYSELDELQQFEYDKVNNEIKGLFKSEVE